MILDENMNTDKHADVNHLKMLHYFAQIHLWYICNLMVVWTYKDVDLIFVVALCEVTTTCCRCYEQV